MNHVFNLLITIMCAVCTFELIVAENFEAYVFSTVGLLLSSMIFIINLRYPLFRK
jgi:hypothetical protein